METGHSGSGTVSGLFAFLDFLVEKGYATHASIGPWKSATRQVFKTMEGDDYEDFEVKSIDREEYLDRFENRVMGKYKAESLSSYRSRFRKALDAYTAYLENQAIPTFRASPKRPAPSRSQIAKPDRDRPKPATQATTTGSGGVVEYPFPLRGGGFARLQLPAQLEKVDAERLAAFVRTLVFDPQAELPPGQSDSEGEK